MQEFCGLQAKFGASLFVLGLVLQIQLLLQCEKVHAKAK